MKKNDILLILVPSFIFALAWIGFSIYHSIITSTISEVLNVQITPIDPTFDTSAINSLKTRENVSPIYELSSPTQSAIVPASSSASPIVINTTRPIVSSASSQQATSGGGLTQ
ncbi:MAG TPA: hypothetical protein VMR59_00780 [Patescibacteria group bacterium]|jgi:hypothetical protein|nr:hypothetical protein [Patescibacteria group bacterium]